MQELANIAAVELRRAENLRQNLRRIFDAWGNQRQVARDAGLHHIHIAQILSGEASNPTIRTIEALSIAMEISLETLLASAPSDSDLRISQKKV